MAEGCISDFEKLSICEFDAVNKAAADSFESFMNELQIVRNSSTMYKVLLTLSKAHPSINHPYDGPKREAINKLNYTKLKYQAAYLYLYFPTICHTTMYVLEEAKDSEERTVFRYLNSNESRDGKHLNLNICSFGGGPGTNVLGLYMYMDSKLRDGETISINATVLDKCTAWEKSWEKLSESLKGSGSDNIKMEYRAYDIAEVDVSTADIEKADVIMMIKFFSVLMNKLGYTDLYHGVYRDNLLQIFREAKAGSLLVIGDNKTGTSPNFILDNVQQIAEEGNFELCTNIETKNFIDGEGRKVLPGDNTDLMRVMNMYCKDTQSNPFFYQRDRKMEFVIMRKNTDNDEDEEEEEVGEEKDE